MNESTSPHVAVPYGTTPTKRPLHSTRAPVTAAQLQRDITAHDRLRLQAAMLMAGRLDEARQLSGITAVRAPDQEDARRQLLKELFGDRRSIRAGIVLPSAERPETTQPVVFQHHREGGVLPRLARPLSDVWRRLLASVSRTSVAGRRLLGSQGRNLAVIVDMLRRRCFLRLDATGQPVLTREVVTVVVDGGGDGRPGFAAECGMSQATFYRALRHPLAHLFLRTQKVQAERDGQRVNVATRFSVALYDPAVPDEVTELLWGEPLSQDEVFVVQDYTFQDAPIKEDPSSSFTGGVENSKNTSSTCEGSTDATRRIQQWEDSAPFMASRSSGEPTERDAKGGCETFHFRKPDAWELATQIALNLGEKAPRAAAITYYRALIWLGETAVKREFQSVHRMLLQRRNRPIERPGAMLTSRLSRLAERKHGFRLTQLDIEGYGLAV